MTTTTTHPRQPAEGDYAPYYGRYVAAAQTDDILELLIRQKTEAIDFFKAIVWEKWEQAYAPEKWTLAEVVLHLIDAERIFAYRALRIARGDQTPLAGFEQDDYVPTSEAATRTPASIVDEFAAVREATVQLFKNFTDTMWERRGTASELEVTVTALAFIMAGHTAHHLQVIRERYL
ncbi:MAG: DinB family protein [Saprospiraceae bacterium]|nr:DinB family protein [Saprospiraceae bacterium]